jgi:hypothetical protein
MLFGEQVKSLVFFVLLLSFLLTFYVCSLILQAFHDVVLPRIQADAARRAAKVPAGLTTVPTVSKDTQDLLVASYDRLRELCTPVALGALAAAVPDMADAALQLPQKQLSIGVRARPLAGSPTVVSAYSAVAALRNSAELMAIYAATQVSKRSWMSCETALWFGCRSHYVSPRPPWLLCDTLVHSLVCFAL